MPASRGVAQDGSSGDFFPVVMPITLPWPDLMCGIAPGFAFACAPSSWKVLNGSSGPYGPGTILVGFSRRAKLPLRNASICAL
jgi:hypothetical protein